MSIKYIVLLDGKLVGTSSLVQTSALLGTLNQISVNGQLTKSNVIFGLLNVILSLPQSIGTVSDVIFNTLELTSGLKIIGGLSSLGGNIVLLDLATNLYNPVRSDRLILFNSSVLNITTTQSSNNLLNHITIDIGWTGLLSIDKGGTNYDYSGKPSGSMLALFDNRLVPILNVQGSSGKILLMVLNQLPTMSNTKYIDKIDANSFVYAKLSNVLTSSKYGVNSIIFVNNNGIPTTSNNITYENEKMSIGNPTDKSSMLNVNGNLNVTSDITIHNSTDYSKLLHIKYLSNVISLYVT